MLPPERAAAEVPLASGFVGLRCGHAACLVQVAPRIPSAISCKRAKVNVGMQLTHRYVCCTDGDARMETHVGIGCGAERK